MSWDPLSSALAIHATHSHLTYEAMDPPPPALFPMMGEQHGYPLRGCDSPLNLDAYAYARGPEAGRLCNRTPSFGIPGTNGLAEDAPVSRSNRAPDSAAAAASAAHSFSHSHAVHSAALPSLLPAPAATVPAASCAFIYRGDPPQLFLMSSCGSAASPELQYADLVPLRDRSFDPHGLLGPAYWNMVQGDCRELRLLLNSTDVDYSELERCMQQQQPHSLAAAAGAAASSAASSVPRRKMARLSVDVEELGSERTDMQGQWPLSEQDWAVRHTKAEGTNASRHAESLAQHVLCLCG